VRHEAAIREASPRGGKVWSEVCSDCRVGEAHQRGEKPQRWPNGARIQLVQLVPVKSLVRPKLIGRTLDG
jgi:hypothetical protein